MSQFLFWAFTDINYKINNEMITQHPFFLSV